MDYPDIGLQVPRILLPGADVELESWAVIACDQYALGDGNHSFAAAKEVWSASNTWRQTSMRCSSMDSEQIQRIPFITSSSRGVLKVKETAGLQVVVMTGIVDAYCNRCAELEVDYIHGDDVIERLASRPKSVGFMATVIDKKDLFPTVLRGGPTTEKIFLDGAGGGEEILPGSQAHTLIRGRASSAGAESGLGWRWKYLTDPAPHHYIFP